MKQQLALSKQITKEELQTPNIPVYYEFYKKQVRKDLIDKLNCSSVSDIDLSCSLKFKGYFNATPSDRNFRNISSIVLAYHYLLESFFCQKIRRLCQVKKNRIQRDQPDTFYFHFETSIQDPELLCDLFQRLFICTLFQQQQKKNFPRPYLKFFFQLKRVFLKRFDFHYTPWTKVFRSLSKQKEFISTFTFDVPHPICLFLILSRMQLYRFISTSVNLLTHTQKEISLVKRQNKIKTIFNIQATLKKDRLVKTTKNLRTKKIKIKHS